MELPSPLELPSPQAPDQSKSSPSSSATIPLDPDIKMDLLCQLELNRDQIISCYASFVSCLSDNVRVTAEDLRTYLLKLPAFACSGDDQENMLLSGVKAESKEADTINKIFDLIGEEHTSYLNYDVYILGLRSASFAILLVCSMSNLN